MTATLTFVVLGFIGVATIIWIGRNLLVKRRMSSLQYALVMGSIWGLFTGALVVLGAGPSRSAVTVAFIVGFANLLGSIPAIFLLHRRRVARKCR